MARHPDARGRRGTGKSCGPPRRGCAQRGGPVRRRDSPRDAQDRGPFHRATLRALERRGRRPNDRPPLARRPRHEREGAEEHRPVGQPLPASPSRGPWRSSPGTPDPRCFPTAEASTELTRGVLPTGDMDRSRALGLRFVLRRTRPIPFLDLAASMRPSSAAPPGAFAPSTNRWQRDGPRRGRRPHRALKGKVPAEAHPRRALPQRYGSPSDPRVDGWLGTLW